MRPGAVLGFRDSCFPELLRAVHGGWRKRGRLGFQTTGPSCPMILAFGGAISGSAPRERQGELEAQFPGMHLPRGCALGRLRYLQWMKSGTGLCWLNEAASRFMQISTLSPAMIRTAALFSSSKICRCREAHRSSMKSSGKTDTGTETPCSPSASRDARRGPHGVPAAPHLLPELRPGSSLPPGFQPPPPTTGTQEGPQTLQGSQGRVPGRCMLVGE